MSVNMPGPNFRGLMQPGNKKYLNLYLHLCDVKGSTDTLSFAEIDSMTPKGLPASARQHSAWWSNHSGDGIHPQTRAWLAAGWKVSGFSFSAGTVSFLRTQAQQPANTPRPNIS